MQTVLLSNSSNSFGFTRSEESKALEISGIAIWEYNLITKEGKCNINWYHIFGYNPGDVEISPSGFYSLIHPEDAASVDNAILNYLESKIDNVLEVPFRLRTKNGDWKWVRSRSSLEVDEANIPIKWLGSLMEISRLKKTESIALENNRHLNSVVNSLSDIIFEINKDFIFINCWIPENNPLSERVKSFAGKNIEEVYGKTIFGHFKSLINKTFQTKNKQEFLYYAKRSKKHYLAKTTLLPISDSGLQHVTMVIQDVTEMQKTQLELEQKQANLNAVIQNTSDVFWAIDRQEKMIVFNKAFEDLYYFLSEKAPKVGQILDDGFLREETAKRWRLIHKRSLNGKNTEFSKHVYFTDGKVRLYEFHINPYKNEQGEIIGSVVTGRDIDDIYTAKKQAEKAARLKSKFVSTISHEIRTPLNAILGTCHQLVRNNLQENLMEDLDILQLASDNLLSLINDVLDFTKLDSGKSIIKPTEFNLPLFLKGINQFSCNLAAKKNLKFISNIQGELPAHIYIDKTKLHQILTNLLSNAIKYTDSGTVNFTVNSKLVSKTNAKINFEIKDSGIGIPKADIEGIFDSFTQSSTSYNMLKGGTGLGLAITKNLVNLLGGVITVESKIDKGSTFNFDIEMDIPKKQEGNPKTPRLDTSLKGTRVLIAEDNEINAKIITRLLGQWDSEFDLAVNGEIAVELAQQNDYNLILMDIQMPKMNGFEASNEIKSNKTGRNRNTPILALTAQPDFSFDPSYKEGLFDGYILKPFHPDNLKSRILEEAIPNK